jgi:hypothetical protein
MERNERGCAALTFRTRHDGVFGLDIKVSVIRDNRRRATALKSARAALGDTTMVVWDEADLAAAEELIRGTRNV